MLNRFDDLGGLWFGLGKARAGPARGSNEKSLGSGHFCPMASRVKIKNIII